MSLGKGIDGECLSLVHNRTNFKFIKNVTSKHFSLERTDSGDKVAQHTWIKNLKSNKSKFDIIDMNVPKSK